MNVRHRNVRFDISIVDPLVQRVIKKILGNKCSYCINIIFKDLTRCYRLSIK